MAHPRVLNCASADIIEVAQRLLARDHIGIAPRNVLDIGIVFLLSGIPAAILDDDCAISRGERIDDACPYTS